MAVHVLLNEIGAEFELVKAAKTEESFLKLNPRGAVPVLDDDGLIIREGAAILMYLIEKHNSPLLPKSGKERAAALEWLMSCNATLHPAYSRGFFIKGNVKDEKFREEMYDLVFAQIEKLWDEFDARLAKSRYLAGDKISIADILMTVIANWSFLFPRPVKIGSNVKRVFRDVIAMPSYVKALEAEHVEYKAAA